MYLLLGGPTPPMLESIIFPLIGFIIIAYCVVDWFTSYRGSDDRFKEQNKHKNRKKKKGGKK